MYADHAKVEEQKVTFRREESPDPFMGMEEDGA